MNKIKQFACDNDTTPKYVEDRNGNLSLLYNTWDQNPLDNIPDNVNADNINLYAEYIVNKYHEEWDKDGHRDFLPMLLSAETNNIKNY